MGYTKFGFIRRTSKRASLEKRLARRREEKLENGEELTDEDLMTAQDVLDMKGDEEYHRDKDEGRIK